MRMAKLCEREIIFHVSILDPNDRRRVVGSRLARLIVA